jgi:cytochrome b6-f complex iron-sulfur subunit
MERRDFINNLGQALTFICAGSLMSACSKSSSTPSSQPFTVDLGSQLTSVGSAVVNGNVIVIRTATGNVPASFDALSLVCTHQGCRVGYDQTNQVLVCPCHGSVFNLQGQVLQGPAVQPLPKYTVTINSNILTVS